MWVRFDDRFPRHPRVHGRSINAKWLFVEATCYAGEFLTDGYLSADAVAGFLHELSRAKRMAAVREIVDAGLWLEVPGGYLIHDFLDYNPSRRKVEADRAATKKRVDALRERRSGNGSRNGVTNTVSNTSPVPDPSSASLKSLSRGVQRGNEPAKNDDRRCRQWLEQHRVPYADHDVILTETRRQAMDRTKGQLKALDAYALSQKDRDSHLLEDVTREYRRRVFEAFDSLPDDAHYQRWRSWLRLDEALDLRDDLHLDEAARYAKERHQQWRESQLKEA